MKSFPLVKTKWSNERVMVAAFFAAVLYMLPGWAQNPGSILSFLAVLAFGLCVDTAANFIWYKRPVCAVSAAVTVAVLMVLSPGVPLWGELLGVAAALLAGKHAWGGTGKNPVNPAVLGLLFLSLLFPLKYPAFDPSLLLLPAVLLSLPFIAFRPFAAAGMMAGMAEALLLNQGLTFVSVLSYGMVFWGCLVITDPVTTTPQPLPGALAGLLAGFLPLYFGGSAAAMALGVLAANILSLAADRLTVGSGMRVRLSFKKKGRIPYSKENTSFYDLAGEDAKQDAAIEGLTKDEILGRIERNGVFGFGGAAFPTIKKIRAALEANTGERHLIVNGVECDPGLIHDKWLLRNRADEIVRGIRLLQKCIPFESVTVAVKDAEGLRLPENIAVYRVPDYYPAGAEKTLIREVLKMPLPYDALPAKEGILVLNAQTVFAIYEAACLDRKADTRLITVADINGRTGSVARVRLGANARDVVETVYPCAAAVFSGGGMMNAHMASDEAVVDETVNFLATGGFPVYRESPLCSRCGYCGAVCPEGLKVNEIARLVDEENMEQTIRLHPERCLACGSCSHVCLAGRNLAARMSAAKTYIKNSIQTSHANAPGEEKECPSLKTI